MMAAHTWLSIALGVGLGLLYNGSSYLTARYAMRCTPPWFSIVFFGGLIARVIIGLLLVMLLLMLVPLRLPVFVGSLLVVFTVGLALEVAHFHRREAADRRKE